MPFLISFFLRLYSDLATLLFLEHSRLLSQDFCTDHFLHLVVFAHVWLTPAPPSVVRANIAFPVWPTLTTPFKCSPLPFSNCWSFKIPFSLVYVLFFHSTYCPVFVCLPQLGSLFYEGRQFSVSFSVLSLAHGIVPNTLALGPGAWDLYPNSAPP